MQEIVNGASKACEPRLKMAAALTGMMAVVVKKMMMVRLLLIVCYITSSAIPLAEAVGTTDSITELTQTITGDNPGTAVEQTTVVEMDAFNGVPARDGVVRTPLHDKSTGTYSTKGKSTNTNDYTVEPTSSNYLIREIYSSKYNIREGSKGDYPIDEGMATNSDKGDKPRVDKTVQVDLLLDMTHGQFESHDDSKEIHDLDDGAFEERDKYLLGKVKPVVSTNLLSDNELKFNTVTDNIIEKKDRSQDDINTLIHSNGFKNDLGTDSYRNYDNRKSYLNIADSKIFRYQSENSFFKLARDDISSALSTLMIRQESLMQKLELIADNVAVIKTSIQRARQNQRANEMRQIEINHQSKVFQKKLFSDLITIKNKLEVNERNNIASAPNSMFTYFKPHDKPFNSKLSSVEKTQQPGKNTLYEKTTARLTHKLSEDNTSQIFTTNAPLHAEYHLISKRSTEEPKTVKETTSSLVNKYIQASLQINERNKAQRQNNNNSNNNSATDEQNENISINKTSFNEMMSLVRWLVRKSHSSSTYTALSNLFGGVVRAVNLRQNLLEARILGALSTQREETCKDHQTKHEMLLQITHTNTKNISELIQQRLSDASIDIKTHLSSLCDTTTNDELYTVEQATMPSLNNENGKVTEEGKALNIRVDNASKTVQENISSVNHYEQAVSANKESNLVVDILLTGVHNASVIRDAKTGITEEYGLTVAGEYLDDTLTTTETFDEKQNWTTTEIPFIVNFDDDMKLSAITDDDSIPVLSKDIFPYLDNSAQYFHDSYNGSNEYEPFNTSLTESINEATTNSNGTVINSTIPTTQHPTIISSLNVKPTLTPLLVTLQPQQSETETAAYNTSVEFLEKSPLVASSISHVYSVTKNALEFTTQESQPLSSEEPSTEALRARLQDDVR